MAEDNQRARDQARAQYESLVALITAYELDWDRLIELREERETSGFPSRALAEATSGAPADHTEGWWEDQYPDEAEELRELEEAAGGYEDQEDVQRAIGEDPLSVQVRSGWHDPGDTFAGDEEFQILLCTGGPAVRIVGELNPYNEADRAWIEYQDWFTGWEQWTGADSDLLCKYANHFLGY